MCISWDPTRWQEINSGYFKNSKPNKKLYTCFVQIKRMATIFIATFCRRKAKYDRIRTKHGSIKEQHVFIKDMP